MTQKHQSEGETIISRFRSQTLYYELNTWNCINNCYSLFASTWQGCLTLTTDTWCLRHNLLRGLLLSLAQLRCHFGWWLSFLSLSLLLLQFLLFSCSFSLLTLCLANFWLLISLCQNFSQASTNNSTLRFHNTLGPLLGVLFFLSSLMLPSVEDCPSDLARISSHKVRAFTFRVQECVYLEFGIIS